MHSAVGGTNSNPGYSAFFFVDGKIVGTAVWSLQAVYFMFPVVVVYDLQCNEDRYYILVVVFMCDFVKGNTEFYIVRPAV